MHSTTTSEALPAQRADDDVSLFVEREWLVTNALGGYASGTVSGRPARRYHGLLVAALPAPLGRMMMFNHLTEQVSFSEKRRAFLHLDPATPAATLKSTMHFALETGLPVWRYELDESVLEKRILMPHRANTVHISYRLAAGAEPLRLRLRPGFHFRPHEAGVTTLSRPYAVTATAESIEIMTRDLPVLRMRLRDCSGALVLTGGEFYDVDYPMERQRGYAHRDMLWSPGYFRIDLQPGKEVTLSASTESWDALMAVDPRQAYETERQRRGRLLEQAVPAARQGTAADLVLAADQFIMIPSTRVVDAAWAHAAGGEICSVIAGYHWFTDWGRDTMISLEGLTLVTGRHEEAGNILRTFAHHVRNGLIPNLFPEGEQAGLYHTADATLWFFHALHRYLQVTRDRLTLVNLLPVLQQIIECHLRGTDFGIGVDPRDGLLKQGAEGYQLTWMDAKVGNWVVTPRRGKAVEINALWYNALQLLAGWLHEEEHHAAAGSMREHAALARESFNRRFWCAERGWLYDVVDGESGDDPACRPNQLFAISLPFPVLDQRRWKDVLQVATDHLLTPLGLRSLARFEPQYKPNYDGDLRSRDAAYHQGTVWGWLIGPYIDAWRKVHPQQADSAREFLSAFVTHLDQAGVGSISEIFDANPPFTPRGCIAQAWSVAEVLRCWVETASKNPAAAERQSGSS